MKELIGEQEETHFNCNSQSVKDEAAVLYFLNNNYYSADVLLEEIFEPSQLLLANMVQHLNSDFAKKTRSKFRIDLIIRSKNWFLLYPILFITDLFLKSSLEKIYSMSKFRTYKFNLDKNFNKLNDSLYKQILTRLKEMN